MLAIALAVILGGTALAFGLVTRHLEYPAANAIVRPFLVVAPILVGLAWKLRRPDSRFGLLLIAFGSASWPLALQAANQPAVYSLGVIVGDVGVVLATFYVALAFPVGRLTATVERLIMALVAVAMVARVVWALQTPVLQGGGTLSRCGEACPSNPFELPGPAWIATLASSVEILAIIVATCVLIGWFAYRLRIAPRPRRRALITVGVTSLVFFPMFLVYQVSRRVLEIDAVTLEGVAWIQTALRMLFPIGFAVALVHADLFAGQSLQRLLERLTFRPSPQRWRDAVADALDDPNARVGYWDPTASRYREASGDVLEASEDPAYAFVTVDHNGVPVAAIEVDAILRTDPELLRAAANATLLAVERGTLEGELRASQLATTEAGDQARRRMAQDLHDSAQQRLVALRMHLQMAGERLDRPRDREVLEQLTVNVTDALADIRDVVRGSHLDRLRDHGLERALRAFIQERDLEVEVRLRGPMHLSRDVEDAVYFVVLEALQNVVKHAGPDSATVVTLSVATGELVVEIRDDGAGFDADAPKGIGIRNMIERIEAVGGRLDLRSTPGAGATVTASIPLA